MQEYVEISLRDLILLLLKGWKLIATNTIVVMAIATGVYFTMNSTTYTASSQVKLTFKSDYTSKFGPYNLPQTKAEDFITLLKEEAFIDILSTMSEYNSDQLKSVLTFTPINTTDFTISVNGSSAEEPVAIMSAVKESAEKYINYVVSKKMFTTFETSYNVKLVGLEKSNSDKQKMFTYFETELKSTIPLLNNNVVNPVFSSLSAHLVQVKASLAEIDFSVIETKEYLNDIENNLDNLKSFDDFKMTNHNFDSPKIDLSFKENVQNESLRFNAKTLFPVSLILGVMLGVFIVFFKNYWTNSGALK